MDHIDPDVLALLALGEPAASARDTRHLEECADCRAEVQNLSRAAAIGRATFGAGDLVAPDERVWGRIASDVGQQAAVGQQAPVGRPPVIDLRQRRRLVTVLGVAAAVAMFAGIGAAAWQVLRPGEADVIATASLDPFPDWPDATGSASVERLPDGGRAITVSLDAPGAAGYHEVWLINEDATELVSLGIVTGSTGSFVIPSDLDLDRYDLVDISDEPYDGDPDHSGDSIVRGRLA